MRRCTVALEMWSKGARASGPGDWRPQIQGLRCTVSSNEEVNGIWALEMWS